MKTILATVVLSVLVICPAAAADTGYALRGVEKATPAQSSIKASEAVAPASEATPAKKVRVVLASPYGN